MQVEQFIEGIGGRAVAIEDTGLSKGRISQWCIENHIPRSWVLFFAQKYPEQAKQHGLVTPESAADAVDPRQRRSSDRLSG